MIRSTISAAAVLLAACGGGSSDAPAGPPANVPSAEGYWTGTTSSGYSFTLLTLETGESWGVYGVGNSIYGVVWTQGTWDGTNVSGSGYDYSIANNARYAASFSGTYTAKGSSSGAITSNSQAVELHRHLRVAVRPGGIVGRLVRPMGTGRRQRGWYVGQHRADRGRWQFLRL